MDMYTLLCLEWITNKDLLYCTLEFYKYYVTAWMGVEVWGECMQVYVWLNSFTVNLKLSQYCLLSDYTPIANRKLKKESQSLWLMEAMSDLPHSHQLLSKGLECSLHFTNTQ